MTGWYLASLPVAFALAWLLTGAARRYALWRSVLDVPTARSSHVVPMPRGGGVAIAAVVLSGLVVGGWLDLVPRNVAWGLVGGGALVAGIGWLDDHRGVRARARVAVHFAAAWWAVFWLGGMPHADLGVMQLRLGPVGSVLGAVGIVWAINFYNFMDGIDGLAGSEAVLVALTGGLLLLWRQHPGLAYPALLTAAASAGFLLWNWSPARIFMGDSGSGLLGFVFGALTVATEASGALPALTWVILLGVFVFDATVTLGRRLRRGEIAYMAHLHHAYQRLVLAGWPHARVTSAVIVINVVLAALVVAATMRPAWLPVAFGAALLLLGGCYLSVERRRPMTEPASMGGTNGAS